MERHGGVALKCKRPLDTSVLRFLFRLAIVGRWVGAQRIRKAFYETTSDWSELSLEMVDFLDICHRD